MRGSFGMRSDQINRSGIIQIMDGKVGIPYFPMRRSNWTVISVSF